MKHYGASASSIDALKPFFLLPEDCLTSLDIIELEVQKLFANNRAFANRDSATAANDYSRFKLTTAYANASSVVAMGVRFAIDKIVSLLAESMCAA
ncbi:unnamed protein product [Peronospora farinosa]|uniref:Uncharacterized protein n=1 Tax=Peronospora farinosa TaxID=134698 RepID=A0ABN8C4A1_9STRA|nr:unnamed protein product [Peronospora farinosa]